MSSARDWVVLKFGGTSVSTEVNWRSIAGTARERLADGSRVLIVHSALSGVTDRLEKLLALALGGQHGEALESLRQRHLELASTLRIEATAALAPWFAELGGLLEGISRIGEVADRDRAKVMAMGELLATELGALYLRSESLPVTWVDARSLLRAEARDSASAKAEYLSATCDFRPSGAVQARLAALSPLVITQGFIASNEAGDTVLLGRGGSDTSGAYFAALLAARQLEIWTDVPGMFSANPRSTPGARQLLELTYDEAQEIATAGAKVLHPRCLLPARQYDIPLYVYATQVPLMRGTRITTRPVSDAAQVKAVCVKKGVTLVSLDSPGMWHQVGFLADAFQVFKRHGLSVDLVSTSETNVTVSLDPQANSLDEDTLGLLQADLAPLCRAEIIGPCASVSLVGRNIRSILHQLGPALELFAEQRIYLVSQAANDLNLTFVVDESQGDRLVEGLHHLLVEPVRDGVVLGPSWQQLFKPAVADKAVEEPWWRRKRDALRALMRERDSAYVYDLETVAARCRSLRALRAIDRVAYAMKANWHPEVLRRVHAEGLAIECVSRGEIERALAAVPGLSPADILFTPNFAPRGEYAWALQLGVRVTLDNLHPLQHWPELFANREIFVRVDPGIGRGHHAHVRTGGTQSKFGIARGEVVELVARAEATGARVVGLHAHAGSGIFDLRSWLDTAEYMLALRAQLPLVRVFDLGGGLGVPDRTGGAHFDLAALDSALLAFRERAAGIEFWLEPGRYVVAEAGVLLARVTQRKAKGEAAYVGVATGMNSLIRPALYGAHHEIVNLDRLDDPDSQTCDIVGPICETGDVLGHDRPLPRATAEGDLLLIATAGAYGAVMSSHYNLRPPATEFVLA
ncbi:MAG: bifunctional aspartate kinase/diaminopimelate decarboxylase [Gammaproteobacteria bacterium]|nr:bifunctional aspartate kinase/diaminopimelate decarboxylase [Gammaproteobacteria bacterium]